MKLPSLVLLLSISASQVSGTCYHQYGAEIPDCRPGDNQIYYDQNKLTKRYDALCCPPGGDTDYYMGQNDGCIVADKPFPNDTPAHKDICKLGLKFDRYVNNAKVDYVEVARDQANADQVVGLCCPNDSREVMFTTLDMAERYEFPHFVKIGDYNCGGTLYNENWIITAAHCISQYETEPKRLRSKDVDTEHEWNDCCDHVRINILVKNSWTEAYYKVEQIVPHPNTSYLTNGISPYDSFNDVALLKVNGPIKFGEHVKALRIAEPGFEPLKYGDTAIIMGFGMMDTNRQSPKLQKANVIIRDSNDVHGMDDKYKDQLLYVGGIRNNKISSSAGKGDSGGPAVCRDKNGMAVLCGITSFVNFNLPTVCLDGLNQNTCYPSAYTAVEHFNQWIKSVAGEQKQEQLLQQPIFGTTVKHSEYPAHVHVVPSEGEPCGGTLVDEDIVLTMASCVAKDPTTPKSRVQVIMNLEDLSKGGGETANVVGLTILNDFKLSSRKAGDSRRKKRVVNIVIEAWENGKLKDSDVMTEPYYENNLALVKIDKKSKKWAKLESKPVTNGQMANEVAYRTKPLGTEANGAKPLTERQIKLLDHDECQRRMDRLHLLGYNKKVDKDSVCGVEWYSGGNLCDRELGGGVYCKGNNGEQVLCAVQTSRWCEFNIPNELKDITKIKSWWIQEGIKDLKNQQ